ncbi:hypothetical protein [Dictyobacter alpinus]|uniref:hypothetical protein n=1 Tax=Dictyobacter alpinus TaxID=2014873 RepID=UPI000F8282FF|nr:hypothetical protein [Dictyobacter alpinus]
MTIIQPTPPIVSQIRDVRVNDHEAEIKDIRSIIIDDKESTKEVHTEPLQPSKTVVMPHYSIWPTSQPGPEAILPPPGQHPHPVRTDQMIYEHYDQEQGRPSTPVVAKPIVAEHRGKLYSHVTDAPDEIFASKEIVPEHI